MAEWRQPEAPVDDDVVAAFDGDPMTRMRLHALAVAASDDAWTDAQSLARHPVTSGLADQLYRAVGSIGANIAEGYSRASARDRARFYEYALGSAREAREWYVRGRAVLERDRWLPATSRLNEICRMLMAVLRRAHEEDAKRRARFDL
jgi:four helix bundle protein